MLLRQPTETTGHLTQVRSIRLSRRDAEDLVLMYADRAEAESQLQEFAVEFVAVAEAAGSIGNLAPLAQVMTEWRHTAEVHADPDLHRALTRTDLVDHGPVPAPDEQ